MEEVEWEYDLYIKGSWNDWQGDEALVRFGSTTFDKENLTMTVDVTLSLKAEGEEVEFGFMAAPTGTKNQVQWGGFSVGDLTAVSAQVEQGGTNFKLKAAGTYNITVEFNEDGTFKKITFNTCTPAAE